MVFFFSLVSQNLYSFLGKSYFVPVYNTSVIVYPFVSVDVNYFIPAVLEG